MGTYFRRKFFLKVSSFKRVPGHLVNFLKLNKSQSCYHIETSQLICPTNQVTGFYMMATLAFNELKESFDVIKARISESRSSNAQEV